MLVVVGFPSLTCIVVLVSCAVGAVVAEVVAAAVMVYRVVLESCLA